MTVKEKRESIILAMLLIAIGFVLYFAFLRAPGAPGPGSPSGAINLVAPGASSTVSGHSLTGQSLNASAPPFLPNGAKIDLNLLQDPLFNSLTAPVYPQVTRSEVGVNNPFK